MGAAIVEKRNCRDAAKYRICVNLQVLILFNMTDQLMNIHCRKNVLPSTTILYQAKTAQTRAQTTGFISALDCQLQKFLILLD